MLGNRSFRLGATRIFKEKLQEGSSSILPERNIEEIELEDIIQAAVNDDVLAIELIGSMGEKLGRVVVEGVNPTVSVLFLVVIQMQFYSFLKHNKKL